MAGKGISQRLKMIVLQREKAASIRYILMERAIRRGGAARGVRQTVIKNINT